MVRMRVSGDGSDSNSGNSSFLYGALVERLRQLRFSSFQNCVFLWLGARSFRDICVLPRSGARGRRRTGGADFIATSPYWPRVKVAVQVRYWQTPVQRRAVDELWGYMLREEIPQGLIVTNTYFYPKAIAAALEFSGRPIRLVSAAQLAGSMAALGLGIEKHGHRFAILEAFFRTLDQLQLASNWGRTSKGVCKKGPSRDATADSTDEPSEFPPAHSGDPETNRWLYLAVGVVAVISWWIALRSWR